MKHSSVQVHCSLGLSQEQHSKTPALRDTPHLLLLYVIHCHSLSFDQHYWIIIIIGCFKFGRAVDFYKTETGAFLLFVQSHAFIPGLQSKTKTAALEATYLLKTTSASCLGGASDPSFTTKVVASCRPLQCSVYMSPTLFRFL